ncbi:MAG: pyruvate dehydrogenase complex dihydrolipoamide acetyltransferase [Mariprofundaceae bacterium]|nr:pyruvate dehydrogenase complex dihydrolipoamide acetyltransferase [Mariprofundaceae bacterium]
MPIDVLMTQLSPTMIEGKVARWLKKEGDVLESGDVMVEIETDKATMEMEVVDEGVLHRIIAHEGETIAVGAAIGVIAEDGETVADDYKPSAMAVSMSTKEHAVTNEMPAVSEQEVSTTTTTETSNNLQQITRDNRRIKATPLARRLANARGISLPALQGSGPAGRIIKADVERALKRGIRLSQHADVHKLAAPRPAPTGVLPYHEDEFERVENSMMRKAIARRLCESKQQVPHFYLNIDAHMDRLMDLRAQLNEAAAGEFKLSVNDFIIKAAAKALVDVPAANASWTDQHTLIHKHAHISVAVAIDGGLITPVVRFAEQKGLLDISADVRELAKRARAGELKPEEYSGGTFSVSNLGMFGIPSFAAIVNPPEGAILAVGATEPRVVVVDGAMVVQKMMTITLSCDHRVVDGAIGAQLLASLKKHLECPAGLLI